MKSNPLVVGIACMLGSGLAMAKEPGGLCAAADSIREAFPEWFPEDELAYLAEEACPALERLVAGECPVLDNCDGYYAWGQQSEVLTSAEGSVIGVGSTIEEEGAACLLPPPPATHFVDGALKLTGTARIDGEEFEEWYSGEWEVTVTCSTQKVEPTLAAMQEEYLRLGCADEPDSDACRNSKYAIYVEQECGYVEIY